MRIIHARADRPQRSGFGFLLGGLKDFSELAPIDFIPISPNKSQMEPKVQTVESFSDMIPQTILISPVRLNSREETQGRPKLPQFPRAAEWAQPGNEGAGGRSQPLHSDEDPIPPTMFIPRRSPVAVTPIENPMPSTQLVPPGRPGLSVEPAAPLNRGSTRWVSRPRGLTVACVAGILWLTFDGTNEDVILHAGESHACAESAPLAISALSAALVRIG